ncbi:MAG: hypothetical protein U0263_13965 [Polyangiaceae bacterium]
MPENDKKRRSGRAERPSEAKPKSKKAKEAESSEPEEKLLSPWGPLVWLLVPLIASVIYGLATRGH